MKKDDYINQKREIMEKMFWVGSNPDDVELYKKQAEEGFKLMDELKLLDMRNYNEL